MRYYSQSTGTTYTRAIHGDDIPDDAVEISDELYERVIANPEPGKIRAHGPDGLPYLIDPPPYVPSDEEIQASNKAKLLSLSSNANSQKNALTSRIGTLQDAVEFDMATEEELAELPVRQAQLTAWKKYAILLGRVTAQPGWALTAQWPEEPAEGMDLSVNPSSARPAAS